MADGKRWRPTQPSLVVTGANGEETVVGIPPTTDGVTLALTVTDGVVAWLVIDGATFTLTGFGSAFGAAFGED